MTDMSSPVKKYYLQFLSILKSARILALEFGHFRSIREGHAINSSGMPIPWYTYPAIEFLDTLDLSTCDVFEFGSGNSSVFWANRARQVVSVEDNKPWFELVQARKRGNQVVLYGEDESSYVGALSGCGRLFDVVVVDGRWRLACVPAAISALKPGGFIVLDNSDRPEEKKCSELLRRSGLFQIDFNGFGPINSYCWSTSIFLKAEVSVERKPSCAAPIGALGEA